MQLPGLQAKGCGQKGDKQRTKLVRGQKDRVHVFIPSKSSRSVTLAARCRETRCGTHDLARRIAGSMDNDFPLMVTGGSKCVGQSQAAKSLHASPKTQEYLSPVGFVLFASPLSGLSFA